jgi:putative ABC transport system permease protein
VTGGRGWRRYVRIFRADPRTETDDELSFHLEMRTRDYEQRGASEAEARAAAAARLGNVDAIRSECARIDEQAVRERRRRQTFSEVRQDLGFGARTLARVPAFTAMAVLTLALGIGATTAIFSVVDAVLLAPLPYPEADRLVRVWETSPQGETRNVVSPGNVIDWQASATSFSALGAFRPAFGKVLTGDGAPDRVQGAWLQPAALAALGVPPLLGRLFVEEDAAGAGDVVLLSHGFWHRRYGADLAIINRRIVLDDVPYTVVGVMPAGFAFPDAAVDLWQVLPDSWLDPTERRSHNNSVLARLAPGVTIGAAQSEMMQIAAAVAREHPQYMTGWGVNVVPLHADMAAQVRPLLIMLLGAVAVVLLIACGNLTNLLLARGVARQREIAVRSALGASRARIARQLLTESLLLAVLGGAASLAVAPALLHVLVATAPDGIPLLERAAINGRILLVTGALVLGCALLFGLVPATRLLRTGAQATLHGARAGDHAGQARLRAGLLVAQVALSVVLLIGAGLFVRSFVAIQATHLGFDADGIVMMNVDLPQSRYPDTPEHTAFFTSLIDRVRAIPGVERVAGTNGPPGSQWGSTFSFSIEGRIALNPSGREDDERLYTVTPGYFELLGQSMVAGRAFDTRDRAGTTPVVIISRSLADKHWPGEDPVGRRISFRAGDTPWMEIVGVAEDVRLASPDQEPIPLLYVPYEQKPWPWLTWLTVLARVHPGTEQAAMKLALRNALLELDPALPPRSTTTAAEAFRDATARRSFSMTLVAGFGAVALLLTVIGLYGLLAYNVAREQREIGVHMALGASAALILQRVVRRSFVLASIGAAAGVAIALVISRAIESLLYGVSPVDAMTYVGTVLIVLATALLTALVPARRAARTSPLHALRAD